MKFQMLPESPERRDTSSGEKVAYAETTVCTVCVIERNPLAAEYLAALLKQDSSIEVHFFDQFVNSGMHASPLVFCLDQAEIVLPLRDSLKLLKRFYPDARYILLNSELGSDHLRLLVSSEIHSILRHGSVKECLLEAVRAVSNGTSWVHPEFIHCISPGPECFSEFAPMETLTQRESEILHLVRNHFSNKEISILLEIEESTVKFHLSHVLAKRKVSRRDDLAGLRIEGGWRTLLLARTGRTSPALRSLLK
jgi:DNA-binding NarL/FixJ family response regulator